MGKILVYYVRSNKTIEPKYFKYKENKLIVGKDREILFSPEHLFLKKRSFPFPPKPCLILQEGKAEPEKIGNPIIKIPNLFPPMTYGDLLELIKKEVAKARMRVKPISLNLFIILLLLHIFQIVMIIMLMQGVKIA